MGLSSLTASTGITGEIELAHIEEKAAQVGVGMGNKAVVNGSPRKQPVTVQWGAWGQPVDDGGQNRQPAFSAPGGRAAAAKKVAHIRR